MKKIYSLFSMLLIGSLAFIQAQAVESGKMYKLYNPELNAYLTMLSDKTPADILTPDEFGDLKVDQCDFYFSEEVDDANQTFLVTATDVPDVFNLAINGKYLGADGWKSKLRQDPTNDNAKIEILASIDGLTLRVMTNGAGAFYGPDPSFKPDGAARKAPGIYTDKQVAGMNGEEVLLYWEAQEVAPPTELAIASISPSDNAQDLALNVDVSVNFNKVISLLDAKDVSLTDDKGNDFLLETSAVGASLVIRHQDFEMGSTYTATIPAGTIDGYNQAITWTFKTKMPLQHGNVYNIKNVSSGLYLTVDDLVAQDNFGLYDLVAGAPNQEFEIAKPLSADPEISNVMISATEKYLALKGGNDWTVGIGDNNLDAKSQFRMLPTEEEGMFRLQNVQVNRGAMGPQPQKDDLGEIIPLQPGALVYMDNTEDHPTQAHAWPFTVWQLELVREVSGLENTKGNQEVTVYPTLSRGTVHVTTSAAATVTVRDLSGRALAAYQSTGNLSVSMNYANGLYLIGVNNGATSVYKVVLQK